MSFIKKSGKVLSDVIPGLGRLTYDKDIGTVFITSGTGVIGYRVAMSLLESGHKSVRVGIFMGEREQGPGAGDNGFAQNIAEILAAKGAEVIPFDWTDAESYDNALDGCKSVFCTLPHMEQWASAFPDFMKACKDKKVEHFVKISFLQGKDTDRYRENVPFVRFHSTCDDILAQAPLTSRISYTILCTSHQMATPLIQQGELLRNEHKFVTASYGMGVNYVSPNDIADAALVVLLNRKDHRNKKYELTGPGPTYDSDVAKLLSKTYGTDIQHVQLGYHDFKKLIKRRGLPSWLVRDAAEFERMKAMGLDEQPSSYTHDLEKLIGKTPESFADYLDNKNSQRPGMTWGAIP